MTQQELADRLGCIVTTIARYETGLRLPGPAMMKKICGLSEGLVEPNDFYDLPPAPGSTLSHGAAGGRGNGAGGGSATRARPIAAAGAA